MQLTVECLFIIIIAVRILKQTRSRICIVLTFILLLSSLFGNDLLPAFLAWAGSLDSSLVGILLAVIFFILGPLFSSKIMEPRLTVLFGAKSTLRTNLSKKNESHHLIKLVNKPWSLKFLKFHGLAAQGVELNLIYQADVMFKISENESIPASMLNTISLKISKKMGRFYSSKKLNVHKIHSGQSYNFNLIKEDRSRQKIVLDDNSTLDSKHFAGILEIKSKNSDNKYYLIVLEKTKNGDSKVVTAELYKDVDLGQVDEGIKMGIFNKDISEAKRYLKIRRS